MNITGLDLFDLYGDGTLVMKTAVDGADASTRYTWYVKQNGKTVYKGAYQRDPFTAVQLEHLGTYVVKAFVRDGEGSKLEFEATFSATKRTSPTLAQAAAVSVPPVASHVSGGFWQFSVEESFEPESKFAWYIYQEGVSDPMVKMSYSNESKAIYKFETAGRYYFKAFVIQGGNKQSASSNVFEVTL